MRRKQIRRPCHLGSLCLLVLAACDDADRDVVEQAITIRSIALSGTTGEAATVTADQQADADGTADTRWSVAFDLEDRIAPATLPADDGRTRTHTVDIKSVPAGAGSAGRIRVRITLRE